MTTQTNEMNLIDVTDAVVAWGSLPRRNGRDGTVCFVIAARDALPEWTRCYTKADLKDVKHMMHVYITLTAFFEFNPKAVHDEFMKIKQYAREVEAHAWWGIPGTHRPLRLPR